MDYEFVRCDFYEVTKEALATWPCSCDGCLFREHVRERMLLGRRLKPAQEVAARNLVERAYGRPERGRRE
jgi:hypothetical protein